MNKNSDSFFRPLLSTLGLVVSFTVAILPLITKTSLSEYFINRELAYPSSLISAFLGIIITWLIITFYPYMQINLGKYITRNNEYKEYWKVLGPAQIIWIGIVTEVLIFFIFFNFPDNSSSILSVMQAVLYIVFFDLLIFIFALLVSNTKSQFEFMEKKDKFAESVFRTLEKNKLINPGISIYENQLVKTEEFQELDIRHIGMARKVKLQTVIQEKETIEIIVNDDGTELLKLLKKHRES